MKGPIEEQILFKTLFQNNTRWKEINLDTIFKNSHSQKLHDFQIFALKIFDLAPNNC